MIIDTTINIDGIINCYIQLSFDGYIHRGNTTLYRYWYEVCNPGRDRKNFTGEFETDEYDPVELIKMVLERIK